MLPITKRQIKYNYSNRNGTPIKFIVIHDTGNRSAGSNAQMHFTYFNGGNRNASADFFVDDHSIWQVNDYKIYNTWQCGDGNGAYGITNKNSIGIEMCINSDGNFSQTLKNTIDLTVYLMKDLGIPLDRVVRHYDASRKNCPQNLNYNGWAGWTNFKNLLKNAQSGSQSQTQDFGITEKDGVATILVDTLNVRNAPDGDIIGTVNKGAQLKVSGLTSNGWYKVTHNNNAAYISSNEKYVKFTKSIVQSNFTITTLNGTATVIIDTLNVRNVPNGNILGTTKRNDKYQVSGLTSNGWYKIVYNNSVAYISANEKYVKFDKINYRPFAIYPKDGVAMILVDTLNIRKVPDGDIIGTIKKDANYQVTGITNDNWYRIPYNGDVAYISANPEHVKFSENIWGYITMQNLEEVKKALNIPNASWATADIAKAKANGIIKSDHSPNEIVTMGVLCTMLNNMMDQLRK